MKRLYITFEQAEILWNADKVISSETMKSSILNWSKGMNERTPLNNLLNNYYEDKEVFLSVLIP